jgi:amino acid adenylation domain-containing protein
MVLIHRHPSTNMSVVNHPAVRLPGPNLLHHLVAQQSQDGQPAIEFLGTDGNLLSITYTELHRASDALARRISGLVVKRPEGARFIVPVLIPQSPELYIALLAILKAGGAFCPMNLDAPSERAKYILEDVAADLVITTPELASKVPQGNHSILIIDDGTCEENRPCQLLRQPRPEDLAYVMYTSGSTGTPKGVGVSHDAVTQSLLAHDRHIPSFSRFLQFAAPTFDVSVFEIFFPLFRGKTLVACHRPLMLNDLPGVIRKMHVDACELTPSVAGSLLRKRDKAPNLRLLLTIGEMLTHPVIEEFGGSDERPSMLWAMYGPTEAAIHCTLQPAASHDSPVSNIGVPLDTVSAFVLRIPEEGVDGSRDIEVLPKGEIGELAVGGYQLADGYLNRPEQTAAAFINSPYGRLYRTGDKARMLPDGRLECLGRISEGQVKLRGQRTELGEVEHAALRVSACHGAVAAVIDAMLVLFCATDDPAEAVSAAVMESCKQWLPGFMLPADIVVVEAFPRLASGKVDKKTLVSNYKSQTPRGSTSFDFKDELEKQIHTLTQEVVGVGIHPTEDLAKAGLDSLGAIKLASVLRKEGLDVGAIDILESRSVSGIATVLRSRATGLTSRATQEAADTMNLELQTVLANHSSLSKLADRVEAVMPCTPLQAAMLAETAVNPRAYCNWIELAVVGGFCPESVRGWIQQLAQFNEILRTGFVHCGGKLLQVIFNTLDEASIGICDEIRRDFELNIGSDLILPFHVQIEAREDHDVGAVVLQIHHALYDGWSLDLLLGDLAELAQGRKLAPRPQFRLITGYLHSRSFNEACNASKEFWASNLHGYQPHALPVLRPEVVTSSAVASSNFTVNLGRDIVNAAMQEIGCAPQSVFQAALAWIWGSILGSEDVVIGGIQSGRTMPITGIEDIIGPCITSVPLRVDMSELRTIKDLIVSVHMGNRSTLAHSHLPLAEIKRVAGIPPGQTCYDVAFVYQESLHSNIWKTGPVAIVRQQDYLETKLLVEVEPTSDRFEVRLTYHSDVFPEAQIKVIGGFFEVMIPFMFQHLNSEITSLRGCFAQGQHSVFNPSPRTFEGVPDLAYNVEKAIRRFPDKDAVCFADHISDGMLRTTTITFAELGRIAESIAWHIHHLWRQERGVIAIVMEKSIRLYAGILAILKTGNAYLPLLPSTPRSRIATILEQANVSLCLVDTATRANLEGSLSCALLDIQGLDLGARVTEGIKCAPDPDRLAYVIYTSGSTGVPKGVCVTQRNILSNLEVLSRIYPVGENSKLLQSCSQAFDVSVFEIFFAWTQGMCLCSATNDTLFEDLERSIRKMGITHLSMTPTVASLVDPTKVPSVEFLVTAGEPLTEPVARKWAGKLYQGYGPSETTNICSVKRMLPGAVVQHLGWCFDNTSAFVMAPDSLDLLPIGCLGELCFGGDQVAQGYLGADELTAAKFINHPQFGRIYRSGDLGRMLPDGSLVIVGRADEQVKIRGQRVELNEITEVIRQSQDGIECATLLLRGDETGSRDQIISYYVPRQHKGTEFRVLNVDGPLALEIRSLFRFVESRLPTYMIPSALIPVSALPITASGKLDRTRLKQEYRNLSSDRLTSTSYGAGHDSRDDEQWSAVEHRIAEVLSASLGVDKHNIGRWTSLITLGVDSISAIQVSRQLHAKLGARLPISVILQNPTVARLAKALDGVVGDVAFSEPLAGERDLIPEAVLESARRRLEDLGMPFTKILPCTPLQEAMLAASTGRNQYVNRMLFRVNGDIEKLKAAWDAMVCRHDILRTCFIATDDPMWPMLQVVLPEWKTPWVTLSLEHQQQPGLEVMISHHADHLSPALDSMEPPVSFAIFNHASHTYLSFICHHALYDGVAIEKLLHEVEQFVSGCLLPPPATCYDQFLSVCRPLLKDTEVFWRTHFEGHTPKLTRHVTTPLIEANAADLRSQLSMALSEIQSRVRELGVSFLSLTQAAWALVLGALFHTDDVCFGNVFNGRTLPIEGINDLIAPCFNTIPIRMNIAGKSRIIDVMKAFQRLDAELLRYQFTPLRRIRSWAFHQHNSLIFDTILLLQQSPRPLDQNIWTLEKDDGEMDVSCEGRTFSREIELNQHRSPLSAKSFPTSPSTR